MSCGNGWPSFNIDVQVYPGGEVYMSPDLIARHERGDCSRTDDAGRYMLVELPRRRYRLRDASYQTCITWALLRSSLIRSATASFRKAAARETARGCRRTVASERRQPALTALRRKQPSTLSSHGYVHFLATDCHGVHTRRPSLAKYVGIVREWIGAESGGQARTGQPDGRAHMGRSWNRPRSKNGKAFGRACLGRCGELRGTMRGR